MALAIHPNTAEMPSVEGLGQILKDMLQECGAKAAYLGGEYVRADMFGQARRSDEITLAVEAAKLSEVRRDRIVQFRPVLRLAEQHQVFMYLQAFTTAEIKQCGGIERCLRSLQEDWEQIL